MIIIDYAFTVPWIWRKASKRHYQQIGKALSLSLFLLLSQNLSTLAIEEPAKGPDLTIFKINAPKVPVPPGFPPFPKEVDFPVALDSEGPSNANNESQKNGNSGHSTAKGSNSVAHAALAQEFLAAGKVVPGFQELKAAVELNKWMPGDNPNEAVCHRMLGDILMEYALKAKNSGRGSTGMRRLLNAYYEYKSSVILDPSDKSAAIGLVNSSLELVRIQTSFNNLLSLASASLLAGDTVRAQEYYQQCLSMVDKGSNAVSAQVQSEIKEQLAKLQSGQLPPANANLSAAGSNPPSSMTNSANSGSEQSNTNYGGSNSPYENHSVAKFSKDKSVHVQDEDETIRVDPFGTPSAYLDNVRHRLKKEWHLSHIQTSKYPSVTFAVDRRGDLTKLNISTSSGNAEIDNDAVNVVRRVAPFANSPPGLGDISYTFEDKPDYADLTDYMRELRRKISHNWHPPHDMQQDHIVASFKVHRDGSIEDPRLTQVSQSEKRNQASLEAIKNSVPFQHLPEGAPDSVEVQFHFDHSLEG